MNTRRVAHGVTALTWLDQTPEQADARVLFGATGDVCHGESAVGSDQRLPVVHRSDQRSRHGDMVLVCTAKRGVRAYHWQFDRMPVVDDASNEGILKITAHAYALQRAKEIAQR